MNLSGAAGLKHTGPVRAATRYRPVVPVRRFASLQTRQCTSGPKVHDRALGTTVQVGQDEVPGTCKAEGGEALSSVPKPGQGRVPSLSMSPSSTLSYNLYDELHAVLQQLGGEHDWSMLKDFSRKEFRGLASAYLASAAQRQMLRDAILAVYSKPNTGCGWNPHVSEPEVLMGIVASDVRLALRGFRDWCEALGLQYIVPELRTPSASTLAEVRGNVYVKYNSRTKLCYVSPYHGKDRGVLLQLGSEQLGHFPLGMWDEEQSKPPPPGFS